ncbi:hypothetical protein PUNSTDRAFT_130489 [Punctularia strigosozonata HHB-11173 SS5]|uniref:uncharacterized protein n=1 Tax=Punctularia strigosozonata (strain HHB-11173) TaxID=741275 RepID=UPI0004417518|nr:uncharacterized protein PUNSTDRAFT_130489 [Punctularia strigosozonata HHB-11173 SS5]EIN12219.1 hypothetical protein PUNSTDRAFT_130489 [Punctularia strigosozonata HHB-11173 SS5]
MLSQATLDIIGLAQFNYSFDSLEGGKPNELNEAMATMFSATEGSHFWTLLQARIPILRKIPTERDRTIEYAQNTMKCIGYALISERKAAIRAEKHGAHVEKGNVQGRDLLSLLIKSNMAVDIPEEQRLSDHDILSHADPDVHGRRPRNDVNRYHLGPLCAHSEPRCPMQAPRGIAFPDTPTMEKLNALPYLDAVIRETLRVHASVSATTRFAMKDEVIPVSEPYTDKDYQP